jgi:hypothetical protein
MQAQATGDSRVALDFALTLNIGSTRLSNEASAALSPVGDAPDQLAQGLDTVSLSRETVLLKHRRIREKDQVARVIR